MRLAIIDLGTNTCNLLIAKVEGKRYNILYQGKEGVKLGKGGINKNMLTTEAFQRAETALKKHLQIISRFQATEVKTIATSAVRDAVNQREFAAYLQKKTGLKLTVISGEEEAAVIFKGVKMAFGQIPGKSLILDIGGGSNELILPEHNEIVWKKSFPLGMARIIEQFHISDPLNPEEAEAIEAYFDHGLATLWSQLDGKTIDCLIGCSGAFDTLADLLDETPPGTKFRITQDIGITDFEQISCQVIRSTADQREKMTGMDPLRLEMIVPSFIFIRLITKRLNIRKISQTGFSLREGVLYEQINC
jgi:exopolyphosphatase/guanosine-5'-triphosphate,3'-diphosphate pyrophosphatase